MAVNRKNTAAAQAAKKSAASAKSIIQSGRGLGALLAKQNVSRVPQNSEMAPLADIEPNPNQPRKLFDSATLRELAASIKVHGLLQPLIVAPAPAKSAKKYRIVAGERRFHACELAELSEVPVRIVRGDEQLLSEIALVENLQREDLTVLETANALKVLMEKHRLTQNQLAERIGWSRSVVANKLRILSLPQGALDQIAAGNLSEGHAKALLSLKEPQKFLEELVADCIAHHWSVHNLQKRIDSLNSRRVTVLYKAPQLDPWRPKGALKVARRLGLSFNVLGSERENRVVINGMRREQVERLFALLDREADFMSGDPDSK
ncbi:ParB/RepB/Spo0J family partition protein [Pyramidobacter sp. CG50-2]|uniref:ParB/RepB/Spo0J family partition protein n=1 Tax=Pyramidobacter sp. CG50-2 TaxID=2382160 RepID=UPI000EA29CA6|nr:ParB/RepB/Spo0J family partition protein [Pyramidobacter sp. CG50-2]RKJ78543.1 ParB/RepB/Spo0J family partition protein [Pyramidobacter sp. CG50-2]